MIILAGCASKKRGKDKEPSALGKFYHNTTAEYNGYFNANEIMKESYLQLQAAHEDNYTEILPVYDYANAPDPKTVVDELDRAIEKVTTVALIHEPSHWVDDCYVLMGEAQYLKRDYETAEETFEYFKEEFNPGNPFGRNYTKKKVNKKALKKEREKERAEAKKEKEVEKKEKLEEREQAKKEREEARKQKEKERKAEQREREKDRKARKKSKSKKKTSSPKKRGSKKRPPKVEETTEEEVENAPEVDTKAEPVKAVPTTEAKEAPRATEEEEEEVVEKKKEKKKKTDKTAYSKGLMWAAKTAVQRDKLSLAKYQVKRMIADGGLPKDVARELPVILADVYIKEKNYEQAIVQLDEAIDLANKKDLKARYAFVAGQLSEQEGQGTDAIEYYKKAKKWTRDFRMEFMAELNTEKSQMAAGGKSPKQVAAKLDRMLKQRKYENYRDQLHYTKGEIALADNDFEGALAEFSKSIQANSNNQPLKIETYHKLAYLFYDREDYVDAKLYFDSTLLVLSDTDDRYFATKQYAENLTDIAANIQVIELQDSLLALTKLSDADLRKLAEKMVEEGMESRAATGAAAGNERKSNLLTGGGKISGRSDFWAYNQQTRNKHKDAFVSVWGNLNLEDDWRRSSSQGAFEGEDGEVSSGPSEEELKEQKVDAMMTTIKKQLPYSANQKVDAFAVISAAMFELGKLFRDKINNLDKAIETHEKLLSRFPNTDKKMDTYYYLYLSNLEKPDGPRADYYKQKIVAEYPDSEYARIIADPAYAASLAKKDKKLENYYQETYASFNAGDYQKAYNLSKAADDEFGPTNPLRPKFSLLNAMALGSIKGKEVYVTALREVIKKYPNTPEKARAEEIMRFLQGDDEAFKTVNMDEVDDIFSQQDKLKHYVAIILFEVVPETLEKTKIKVSEYNKEKYKDLRLQLGDASLNSEKNTEIILVRSFKDKEKSMEYYTDLIAAGDDFIDSKSVSYKIYALTQSNYRKLMIERSDVRYSLFFDKYYLGRK